MNRRIRFPYVHHRLVLMQMLLSVMLVAGCTRQAPAPAAPPARTPVTAEEHAQDGQAALKETSDTWVAPLDKYEKSLSAYRLAYAKRLEELRQSPQADHSFEPSPAFYRERFETAYENARQAKEESVSRSTQLYKDEVKRDYAHKSVALKNLMIDERAHMKLIDAEQLAFTDPEGARKALAEAREWVRDDQSSDVYKTYVATRARIAAQVASRERATPSAIVGAPAMMAAGPAPSSADSAAAPAGMVTMPPPAPPAGPDFDDVRIGSPAPR